MSGFPWDGSSIVRDIYEQQNYCIETTKCKEPRAIVFFSGNGIFYPNDVATFTDTIIHKNRYEWQSIANSRKIRSYFAKIIFVRDIYKQWYVAGINHQLDSVEAVTDFIRSETLGYKLTTCGNSAGGYMAILVVAMLKAEKIFSFSGQFSIEDQVEKAPLLLKYKDECFRNRYFSTNRYISDISETGGVYHFYPAKCEWDIVQLAKVDDDKKILKFAMDHEEHGKTVDPNCYKYILTMDTGALKNLAEQYRDGLIDPDDLYMKLIPRHERMYIYVKRQLKKALRRK